MGIAAFTDSGRKLSVRLKEAFLGEFEIISYQGNLGDFCSQCFSQAEVIIFIGACGIAVRAIAPFVKSKLTDPAVLVMDEKGKFAISLLSGHIGGANEMAHRLAGLTGGTAVVTTASDVNDKIAIDVFAKKNNLHIASMTAAKKTAAAIVAGKPVGFYCAGKVEGEIPSELTRIFSPAEASKMQHLIWISPQYPREMRQMENVLHLIPRNIVLGLGCRRGKDAQSIHRCVEAALFEAGISPHALSLAASIDLKKNEAGLLEFCSRKNIPFITFSAEQLMAVKGEFSASEFVLKTTGADNVCERSALLAAGEKGKLIDKKHAGSGVTVAIASKQWRVSFEK